jgi:hypothetical protein
MEDWGSRVRSQNNWPGKKEFNRGLRGWHGWEGARKPQTPSSKFQRSSNIQALRSWVAAFGTTLIGAGQRAQAG